MKLKELKAILNKTNALDECEIYAGYTDSRGNTASTRILPCVDWRYGPEVFLLAMDLGAEKQYIDYGTLLEGFDPKDYFGKHSYIFDKNGNYSDDGEYNVDGKTREETGD